EQATTGRRGVDRRSRRTASADRRGSGEGQPDVRADRRGPRGGRGHEGAAPGAAQLPRRAGHRRRHRRRQGRHVGGREDGGGRRGPPRANARRGHQEGRRRPDDRALPRLAAPVPALDRQGPAADRRRGGLPRQTHRARRHGRQAAHGRGQPAPRRVDRQGLPRPWPDLPRSHPGGLARPHPRGREVRLPPRLQVLDVRDVVDPPGRHPRDRRQGPDDPHPGPHGGEAQQGRARRAPARPVARPRAHAR
ncbi:MAG: RNA polymerase sigma factor RpoD, partial [uncultured Solirubrobacteraceae bacterium]